MNEDFVLDEMDLPLGSSNEDLKTISANLFKSLFDIRKFEIRSEHLRDKGIDMHIEYQMTKFMRDCVGKSVVRFVYLIPETILVSKYVLKT